MFEFSIPVEIFGLPRPYLDPWYECDVCALDGGPLRATGGVTVSAPHGLERLAQADTIIIPGWRDLDQPPPERLVAALLTAHARRARLASICSGSFLLAATGLLDGRTATTHWHYADQFRAQFPKVRLDSNVLFVDEGQVITAAGSAAGLDLCLHLVRLDFGAAAAAKVARRLIVYPHRDGGQAQFIEHGVIDAAPSKLDDIVLWLEDNLCQDITIETMAEKAALSRRTFLRRFKQRCGLPPHAWIVSRRLVKAQELLEATDNDMEAVAVAAGFGTPAAMRHHFRQSLNTSPQTYRQRFRLEQ